LSRLAMAAILDSIDPAADSPASDLTDLAIYLLLRPHPAVEISPHLRIRGH